MQGLHLFKVFCIFALTQAHALMWMGAAYHENLSSSHFWFHAFSLFSGTFLTFSWLFPFLGGAIFRAILAPSIHDNRLQVSGLRPFWNTFVFCALLESTKHALTYSLIYFSLWGCVHTITFTFIVIAWISRRSLLWLYPVSLAGLALTPYLISIVSPFEFDQSAVPELLLNIPTLRFFLMTLLGALFAFIFGKILKTEALKPKYRLRVIGLLTLMTILGACLALGVSESMRNKVFIGNIWNGMLVGTEKAYFIWAIFPWSFAVMIGFLAYDWILRMKRNRKFNLLLMWGSLTALYLSSKFVAYDQLSARADPTILFSPALLNRGWATFLFSLFLFLTSLPFFVELSKFGFERPWVKRCSRSYFWIYLFQTSVGVLLPQWTRSWIPFAVNIYLIPTFLILCCFIIPWLVEALPSKINIDMRAVD